MSLTMYDAIYVSNLPAGGDAYAGYVDGTWPDFEAIHARFPDVPTLGITDTPDVKAACLDVETGDATTEQAPGWVRGDTGYWRPVVYSSADNMNAVHEALEADGLGRMAYRLFSAHYGDGMHLCGPHTCGRCDVDCDATQWASNTTYDTSILNPDFFGVPVGWKWQEWITAGELTLEEFAAGAGFRPAFLLQEQIQHYGKYNTPVLNYIDDVFTGTISPTAKMPAKLTFWTRVKV